MHALTRKWAIAIFAVSLLTKSLLLLYDTQGQHKTLKYEAYNVAKSIALHSRFADAFGPNAGPTAHVAPVYPFLLAVLARTFQDEFRIYVAVGALTVIAASISYALLPYVARLFGFPILAGCVGGLMGAVLP